MRVVVVLAVLLVTPAAVRAVSIATVPVGNPGNGNDVQPGHSTGAVANAFRMATLEVSNANYTEFLNAVDPAGANSLALYSPFMTSDMMGGIIFSGGAPSGAKYAAKAGRSNQPVVFVSWYDSIRFANWLHNNQGAGSTETGAYNLGPLGPNGVPVNGASIVREPNATWFLPSVDEWHKAAYHKNDGVTANYWDYATTFDTVPYSDQPPGNDAPTPANTANFFAFDGIANGFNDGYAVTGSVVLDNDTNYLSAVGAYVSSRSAYGTFDQGGNASEWNERLAAGSNRGLSGGSWFSLANGLASSSYVDSSPLQENREIGFRVATVASAIAVPGDYNNNGTVDAADYVLWRNGGPLANEGVSPGVVDPADYQFWRARFGATSGAGGDAIAAVPVPEPTALPILAFGIALGAGVRRKANRCISRR